jgi:acetyl esterase/lipase
VTVRLFVPERVEGVCIQFHAGAWIIGSARASDDRSSEIAERCSAAVVSVEYRMVPEHLPPAQLEDALNVIDWVRGEGRSRFGDAPIALIGESAGCTLAVLSLLALRERGALGDDIVGASLAYGLYDLSGGPSQRLDEPALAVFLDAQALVYPGLTVAERRVPSISPLYADLRGLPPALFSVGTADALLDDTLFMYERWTAAGNEADLEVYPESLHAFDAFPTAMAAEARRRIDAFLRARFTRHAASSSDQGGVRGEQRAEPQAAPRMAPEAGQRPGAAAREAPATSRTRAEATEGRSAPAGTEGRSEPAANV